MILEISASCQEKNLEDTERILPTPGRSHRRTFLGQHRFTALENDLVQDLAEEANCDGGTAAVADAAMLYSSIRTKLSTLFRFGFNQDNNPTVNSCKRFAQH